jgi:hypothetical protein
MLMVHTGHGGLALARHTPARAVRGHPNELLQPAPQPLLVQTHRLENPCDPRDVLWKKPCVAVFQQPPESTTCPWFPCLIRHCFFFVYRPQTRTRVVLQYITADAMLVVWCCYCCACVPPRRAESAQGDTPQLQYSNTIMRASDVVHLYHIYFSMVVHVHVRVLYTYTGTTREEVYCNSYHW